MKPFSDEKLRECIIEAHKITLAEVLAVVPGSQAWVAHYVDSGQADDKVTSAVEFAYRQGWKDAREN